MSLKQRTYSGRGLEKMLDTSWYHHLTKENSILKVDDYNDPNTYWTIKVKPGYIHTTI
ncbi:MAG: hypothetical protein J5691_01005 [Bacilli bacterium]|nr:hypothetical protein [Bacilli bacterium]